MYDAIWILAMALNRTMAMLKTGNTTGTGCENISGSLMPLEAFNYSNEKMGCLIQHNIQITNFSGVSVRFYDCYLLKFSNMQRLFTGSYSF